MMDDRTAAKDSLHLSQLMTTEYGLVIINGQLTAVGGVDGSRHYTNKLFTLQQRQ